MTTNYAIDDSNGQQICDGLQDNGARGVRGKAQKIANERNEVVSLYRSAGPYDGVDSETFEPAT